MDQEQKALLRNKKCWILDMDGTIYLGSRLFPETLPFLNRIRENGAQYLFFTNNASRSHETYVKRLQDMGIPVTQEQILTSADTTIAFLKQQYPGKMIYLVGTDDLAAEFRANGIVLYNDCTPPPTSALINTDGLAREARKCPAVVISFDLSVTYEKLDIACRLIRNGSAFLSTHPDFNCPAEGGFLPDSGAMCAFVTASTGKKPRFFGKPYPDVVDMLELATGYTRDEMVIVGDRLYTDIAVGVNNGMDAVAVLSGETSMEEIEDSTVKPTVIVNSVGDLLLS